LKRSLVLVGFLAVCLGPRTTWAQEPEAIAAQEQDPIARVWLDNGTWKWEITKVVKR
jgi:hypothetical protein